MAKHNTSSASSSSPLAAATIFLRMRWLMLLALLALLSLAWIIGSSIGYSPLSSSRDCPHEVAAAAAAADEKKFGKASPPLRTPIINRTASPARSLSFMKSKLVLLVSHKLSVSGTLLKVVKEHY